jgi:hypothetical protein
MKINHSLGIPGWAEIRRETLELLEINSASHDRTCYQFGHLAFLDPYTFDHAE